MKKRGNKRIREGPKFRATKIFARIVGVCSRSALKYILRPPPLSLSHRIITSVPRLCKCLIAKEPANGKKLQRWRQIKSHPRRFEPVEAERRCSCLKNSHLPLTNPTARATLSRGPAACRLRRDKDLIFGHL